MQKGYDPDGQRRCERVRCIRNCSRCVQSPLIRPPPSGGAPAGSRFDMALPLPTEPDDAPAGAASLFDDADSQEVQAPEDCPEIEAAARLPGCSLPDDAQLEAWNAGIADHDERA